MKNPLIFFIFITSLFVSSCCKPDEIVPNVPHPLEQFIGKWVPVEIKDHIIGEILFGPFGGNSIFGAYKESFEVSSTDGTFRPAIYFDDNFNPNEPVGKIQFDPESNQLNFDGEFSLSFKVILINNTDLWLESNKTTIKLKKIL